MKKFAITCSFGGVRSPFTVYIGDSEKDHHPLHFQAEWLSKERGGTIPSEVMESILKLKKLAEENNVSFQDLCTYALQAASNASPEEQGQSSDDKVSEGSKEITPEKN